MKKTIVLLLGLALAAGTVNAEDAEDADIKAASLDELLQMVKEGNVINRDLNARREREFTADKNRQAKALSDAKAEQRREEQRSDRLETKFEQNETEIANLQELLAKRLGSLRELFGVLQQVSGDTQGVFSASIISAQYPGREEWLSEFAQEMGKSSKLATIEEIERLWYELQREMTESAKVSKFRAPVIMTDGEQVEAEVVRIGTFNVVAGGKYLKYDVEKQILAELARQPESRFVSTAEELTDANSGFVQFGLDPSRGQLLSLLIQTPSIEERIHQGSTIGYVIISLGIVAVLLAIERFITLSVIGAKVASQIKSGTPSSKNPLGRVLQVYHDNTDIDSETLQLKLDEQILKEQPAINARISFIKIISMVAPLLGLLGTVTGMIVTFQAITLFGTGDPKTMAGGISQALMTTVLGLCVAIPTVLLHSIVHSRSLSILHILTEQSAGLVAAHAEKNETGGS
jgi:biopolymer transport protein ExbB